MNYPVMPAVIKEFKKIADKRGYAGEQKQEYVNDRTKSYKKIAPVNDVIVFGATAATVGKVAHDAKAGKMKFIKALEKQFAPFSKEMNKQVEGLKKVFKEPKFIKGMAMVVYEGVMTVPRTLKGVALSIPKPIAIPAAILFGGTVLHGMNEVTKIDAKHDVIKYLNDKN